MENRDSLMREFGELSGQYKSLAQRVTSLETRVDQSDNLILAKIESLQADLQKSLLELQKNSSALESHRKIIGIIAAASLAGGGTSAGLVMSLFGA